MSTPDLGLIYGEAKQPVVGVTYYLVHRRGRLNFVKIKEKIERKLDIEELTEEQIKKSAEEELYIPEIFRDEEGRILLKTMIHETILTPSSLFGRATLDRPVTFEYRNRRVLIIDTIGIFFLILYDDRTKRNYLVILGSRLKSRELLFSVNKFLNDLGIIAVPSKLEPEKIDEIRDELKGQLLDTTLRNFPTPRIKMKRIVGRGYQNEPSYLQDAEIGSVHQHMFEYKRGVNPPEVINLSEDGLIRFYTSTSYKDYEWFLRNRVFHRLRQIKKPAVPIMAYTTLDDIFKEEGSET